MREAVAHLVIGGLRKENSPGIRQAFQSRCDVNAIAEDVTILDHDIAHIDANPQLDASSSFRFTAHFGNTVLNFDRTFDGIDSAGKFQEKAVAHCFHKPPAMGRYGGVDDGVAQSGHRGQRTGLVIAHQIAVTDDIGQNDRSKPAFHMALPNVSTRICIWIDKDAPLPSSDGGGSHGKRKPDRYDRSTGPCWRSLD